MKKILLVFLTVSTLAAVAAPRIVPLYFTVTGTVYVQNVTTTTNGMSTTGAPIQRSLTTKSVMQNLALAEYNLGNYPAPAFPANARLVWQNYTDDFSLSYFAVVDGNTNEICDVSDIITWESAMENAVFTGKNTTSTPSMLNNFKENYMGAIFYDDTFAGGYQKMNFSGLINSSVTDTVNLKAGNYKEVISATGATMAGTGTVQGVPAFVKGSISASGSKVLTP